MPQPKPKRGVVSNEAAERVYRALLSTIEDADEGTRLDLIHAVMDITAWEDAPSTVKRFIQALAKELSY